MNQEHIDKIQTTATKESGLEYNTQREKINLSLYGRNINKLVKYLMTVEDREKRLLLAEEIVEAMEILNPKVKSIENYKQVLWTHIAMISNFQLDIDYPCQIKPEIFKESQPEKIALVKNQIKKKQYGRIIFEMIKVAKTIEDQELKDELIENILIQMKKTYIDWGKENIIDKVIFDDFTELSNGELKIPDNIQLPLNIDLKNKIYPQVPNIKKHKK